MSVLPLILSLSDELDDLSLSPSYYRPRIDHGLNMNQQRIRAMNLAEYLNDLQHFRRRPKSEEVVSNVGKNGFQVCMDVQQFNPNELSVKVVGNSVMIEGKHEERQDEHGYISRHFIRRYALPKDYDAEKLISTLSSDGVLTISIPKPKPIEGNSNERIIQIQQTGPAHINVKQNQQDGDVKAD